MTLNIDVAVSEMQIYQDELNDLQDYVQDDSIDFPPDDPGVKKCLLRMFYLDRNIAHLQATITRELSVLPIADFLNPNKNEETEI